MGEERAKLLETLKEGAIVNGVVKNITDYGAFVDLGGIDGLLHITDIAWRRVRHPSEVLSVGQEVTAKILKFDQEKNRVSLGMKQLGDDPWVGMSRRYPPGTRLFGKVTNITDYGAFVEVESGIEGLVHVSEMDWTNKNVAPSKVVQLGDEVEVMVLEIDEDRRRISARHEAVQAESVGRLRRNFKKGDKVKGAIKSITDFGVFIGLPGGIDGLVHLSDLSWSETGEEAVRKYKKGDEVEAIVLGIDVERERISLGIKQLEGDPFSNFVAMNDKGSIVDGMVKSVDAKGAVIDADGRRRRLPARFGNRARPRGRCPQRAEGRRQGQRDDHQHRPQDRAASTCRSRPRIRPSSKKRCAASRPTRTRPLRARRTLARCSRPSSTARISKPLRGLPQYDQIGIGRPAWRRDFRNLSSRMRISRSRRCSMRCPRPWPEGIASKSAASAALV